MGKHNIYRDEVWARCIWCETFFAAEQAAKFANFDCPSPLSDQMILEGL